MTKVINSISELKNVSFDLKHELHYVKNHNIAIHVYDEVIFIQELENALKQGKKCNEHRIRKPYNGVNEDIRLSFWNEIINSNCINLDEFIVLLKSNNFLSLKNIQNFEITTTQEQATRVYSPFVSIEPIKQPSKWTLPHVWKAIISGQITSGKCDGYYTDDYRYDNHVDFRRGKISVSNLAKKIIEHPSGWWVSVYKENEDTIQLSVNCHTFDLNTLYFDKKFTKEKPIIEIEDSNVIILNGDTQATKKQLWALHCITKQNTTNWKITLKEASELIGKAKNGENISLICQKYAI